MKNNTTDKKTIPDFVVDILQGFISYSKTQGMNTDDTVEILNNFAESLEDLISFVKVYHTQGFVSMGSVAIMELTGAARSFTDPIEKGMLAGLYYKQTEKATKCSVADFIEKESTRLMRVLES